MKYVFLAAAIFLGWKYVQGQGGSFDIAVTATPGNGKTRPRPWAVPPGVNAYDPQSAPQNNAQFWASRTHPDSTFPSRYSPPYGGVLVGPQGA